MVSFGSSPPESASQPARLKCFLLQSLECGARLKPGEPYGAAPMLNWIVADISAWEKSECDDGTFVR